MAERGIRVKYLKGGAERQKMQQQYKCRGCTTTVISDDTGGC